ncbi:MAG: hydantoinase/oxoprolinase N-terminal domain-containing protein, partial [Promethearchaeota archaeon]
MGLRVGIDVGGTFTDITILDEETGKIHVIKTPSTVEDQSIGVVNVLKKMEKRFPLDQINYIIHGTTVATNALLERKGAKTALITTEGFRDILYIGRQTRPHIYDFWAKKSEPVVPRALSYEVPERMDHEGNILKDLDIEKANEV